VAARREDTLADSVTYRQLARLRPKAQAGDRRTARNHSGYSADFHRARSWTDVAFLENQVDAKVSFGLKAEGPDSSIHFRFSPENAQGAVTSQGPEGTVRFYAV
jgi:hypothetical protein